MEVRRISQKTLAIYQFKLLYLHNLFLKHLIITLKTILSMNEIDHAAVAGRIKFLIKSMGMSQGQFARKLDIDPGNISKHLNGKLPISRGLINRIAVDLGVSKNWLATGTGTPFEKHQQTPSTIESDSFAEPYQAEMQRGTPVYDIDVTAGRLELSREFTSDNIVGYVNIPEVREGTAIVRVNGDSMQPTISDGAFVAIRPISDPTCIFWGQIYVVVLDDFRMVKHVRRHPDHAKVILHSDNPLYDDMEIDREKIRALYLVESILNIKIQC